MTWEESEGFSPWLPRYIDIVKKYDNYGFNALEIDADRFPIISSLKDRLSDRFFEYYADRRINQETLMRWQLRLQNKFDAVATRYERAYKLYDTYRVRIDEDVIDGYSTDRNTNSHNSGIDKNTVKGEQRAIDTPDKAINHDKNYADRLTDNDTENITEHGLTNDTMEHYTYNQKGSVLSNINDNADIYRDIDTEFVREFENNFLNVFWS